jgi:hypothetical protein
VAEKKQSTDVTVTAFEILQALTGELPCHASPNWESVRQEESREELRSPEHSPRPVRNTPNYQSDPASPINRGASGVPREPD